MHQFDVRPALIVDAGFCLAEHLVGHVHANDLARGTDIALQQRKIESRTATDLDNRVPRLEVQAVDRLLAIGIFADTDQIVEIGGEVIASGSLAIEIDEFLFGKHSSGSLLRAAAPSANATRYRQPIPN